jgi:hypothetical protein
MRINVAEWRKLDRGQKYIMILIAYGYWQGIWDAKRQNPTSAATVVGFKKKSL